MIGENMRYFHKELISTPLYLSTGGKFPFDNVGGDDGVWATEDQSLVREAEAAMSRGIGGIGEIRKEEYDELIKKKIGGPLPSNFLFDPSKQPNPQISVLPPLDGLWPKPAATISQQADDRAQVPDPIQVPAKKDFKPPKARRLSAVADTVP